MEITTACRRCLIGSAAAGVLVAAMTLTTPPALPATTAAKPYDVDGNGYADLVVGAPPGESADRGAVTVIHGARSGWKTSGNYSFSQNTKGVPGTAEKGDLFGSSVTLLDHNRDGRLDLTVGVPGEDHDAGAITTIPGSGTKLSAGKSATFGVKSLSTPTPPVPDSVPVWADEDRRPCSGPQPCSCPTSSRGGRH